MIIIELENMIRISFMTGQTEAKLENQCPKDIIVTKTESRR